MKNHKQKTFSKSILCSALLTAIGSAHSATIVVDNDCNLIDAINSANNDTAEGLCSAGSGADVIQIQQPNLTINISGPLVVPPLPLASKGGGGSVAALPLINSEITIEGNDLTLDGSNASEPIRMFTVYYGGDLTLKDTTVSNANAQQTVGGSGLLSYGGRVTLDNTTFSSNYGGVTLFGGTGNVIRDSVIRHNTLNADVFAAGLNLYYSNVQITNTSIVENEITANYLTRGGGGGPTFAGGIASIQSEVEIIDSTISGNKSPFGAGMTINDVEMLPLSRLQDRFNLTMLGGGGDPVENIVSITNSTIANNQSFYATGILNFSEYGTLTIQGSIIAGNKESLYDFAANIYNANPSALTLTGHNIIGDQGTPGTIGVTLDGTNSSFINSANDNLYPLTLSQGQLMHPLKVNSAAIDSNDLSCFGSINDQTGKARGLDGDGNGSFICDIGSSELSPPILADGAPCTLQNAIISANNDASVGGCQPGNFHDIIQLPTSSTITLNAIEDSYISGGYASFNFGLPGVNSAISLEGNGSTLERDLMSVEDFDILLIEPQGQLNLIDTTITGANGDGGAVSAWYQGNVNVISSNIINNQAMGLLDVSSINSSIINSSISNNSPTSPYSLSNNFAAGVLVYRSSGFELNKSTISNNSGGFIGGLSTINTSQTRITNSTFSSNSGALVGGMYLYEQSDIELNSITVTNNEAYNVGGLALVTNAYGSLTMNNSIISGNQLLPPPESNPKHLATQDDTTALNRGGGVTVDEIALLNANNQFNGTNIIGQNNNSGNYGAPLPPSVIVPTGSSDTVIEDLLTDNGGNTLTHLPTDGGDAVDTGGPFCFLRTDQLDRIRPWDGNNDGSEACDVGAVELGSVTSSDLIFKDDFDAEIIIRRSLKE